MNATDVRTLLQGLVDEVAPGSSLDGVDPAASFQEALDLDSMDFLFVIEGLEAATGLRVPEADYPLLGTLAGFEAYLGERLA